MSRSDWHFWHGDWGWLGPALQVPHIGGHEIGGVVTATGREVRDFREGDRVWALVTTSGGHVGEHHGIPATGKRWTNRGVYFMRLAGGRMMETSGLFDTRNPFEQLGATLTPPARTD